MRKPARFVMSMAAVMTMVIGGLALDSGVAKAEGDSANLVEEGKKVAFNRKKGNCLACHKMQGGSLEGNIGPELVNMKSRYPDKAKLRAQIWDATVNNPNTIMPPFGRHNMLSEEEIDWITEYIYSL